MPQPFRRSITLTILIVIPMLLINKALPYLYAVRPDQELVKLLALVLLGLLLGYMGYRFTLKPIRDKLALSHKR